MYILLLATSRGKGLSDQIQAKLPPKYHTINSLEISGARLETLAQAALVELNSLDPRECKLVVTVAGLPNITKMQRSRNYEEVILSGSTEEIVDNVSSEFLNLAYTLESVPNTYVLISTVIPSNIAKWNFTRFDQSKTQSLQYTKEYDNWQKQLHDIFIQTNKFIEEINISKGLFTPRIHRLVVLSRKLKEGQTRNSYKFSYLHLEDGVHPNQHFQNKIAIELALSLERNIKALSKIPPRTPTPPTQNAVQNLYNEKKISPKRSWRQ
jgi:hypothetical protein